MPNVSYSGDDRDRQLLNLLSVKTGKSVGRLVREAVDALYRSQLDELERSFFATDCADTQIKNDNEKGVSKRKLA